MDPFLNVRCGWHDYHEQMGRPTLFLAKWLRRIVIAAPVAILFYSTESLAASSAGDTAHVVIRVSVVERVRVGVVNDLPCLMAARASATGKLNAYDVSADRPRIIPLHPCRSSSDTGALGVSVTSSGPAQIMISPD